MASAGPTPPSPLAPWQPAQVSNTASPTARMFPVVSSARPVNSLPSQLTTVESIRLTASCTPPSTHPARAEFPARYSSPITGMTRNRAASHRGRVDEVLSVRRAVGTDTTTGKETASLVVTSEGGGRGAATTGAGAAAGGGEGADGAVGAGEASGAGGGGRGRRRFRSGGRSGRRRSSRSGSRRRG